MEMPRKQSSPVELKVLVYSPRFNPSATRVPQQAKDFKYSYSSHFKAMFYAKY